MSVNRKKTRSGTVAICVLACSLVAISLAASTLRLSLQSARESKQTLRLRQAQWLLHAGVQRARLRLADSSYRGEEWEIPDSILFSDESVVSIEVEALGSAQGAQTDGPAAGMRSTGYVFRVRVIAEYGSPKNNDPQIRRSHSFHYQPSRSGTRSIDNVRLTNFSPEQQP